MNDVNDVKAEIDLRFDRRQVSHLPGPHGDEAMISEVLVARAALNRQYGV
jgi:hypothetical protein